MANIAGYRAVLLAATALPKMFPMMTTAAGTITPAKVFIVGAGVAGLQAIASAPPRGRGRLGLRRATDCPEGTSAEPGPEFVEMAIQLGPRRSQGGYAKAMDEDFYRKQRELMTRVVAENDMVVPTAAIPGKKAPTLVTAEMVRAVAPGLT